jgi:HSP20 family molecular chaperone IbpA
MNLIRKQFDFPAMRDEFLSPLQQVFNEFFDDFWKATPSKIKSANFPKMDMGIDNNEFFVKAAVSGFTADDLKIEITPENMVRISGQMSEKYKTPDSTKYYVKELCHRQFVKEIKLPEYVDKNETPEVSLHDGILAITWKLIKPLIPEKPKNKIIPIKNE